MFKDHEQLEDVGLFKNQEELSKNSIIPMTIGNIIGNMKKTDGEVSNFFKFEIRTNNFYL